ncbi:hypothetical protein EV368DRAFT_63060 [Lentinula lateritia]|nr:hypothetical protein EV368DRAFT_63060 [Lentinula lateritia]
MYSRVEGYWGLFYSNQCASTLLIIYRHQNFFILQLLDHISPHLYYNIISCDLGKYEKDTSANSPTQTTHLGAADFPQTKLPEQWISFVQHTTRGGYCCLWESCDYEADKQRLKRHIENTHLKIRRFSCLYCDQKFGQRTALQVHTATKHTHDTPFKCPFDGCNIAYNDSARLHRHKKQVHNYVPKMLTSFYKN